LVPHIDEWRVDKLQLVIKGSWSARSADISREYLDNTGHPPVGHWFKQPNVHPAFRTIKTRWPARSTIPMLEIEWRRSPDGSGQIKVTVSANPTITLHHLLARYGDAPDFAGAVAALPFDEFFDRAPDARLQRSLDGRDNWLPDVSALNTALPDRPFEHFLPIYAEQLQQLVAALVIPDGCSEIGYHGPTMVMDSPETTVSIRWGEIAVPQIETYFERYHSRAVPVMRAAAQRVLSAHARSGVHRYVPIEEATREGDRFSVSAEISKSRRVVAYAKSARRLRFEVRRQAKGDYPAADPHAPPTARLLQIIAHERDLAATGVIWQNYGRMFDEPEGFYAADLVELVSAISAACVQAGIQPRDILTKLLSDGGYSEPLRKPSPVTRFLIRAQIIEEVRLAPYKLRGTQVRYSLVERYRDLPWAMIPVTPDAAGDPAHDV